jgi:hypothetical protein
MFRRSRFDQTGLPAYPRYHILHPGHENYTAASTSAQPWCWGGWWPPVPSAVHRAPRTHWEPCFGYSLPSAGAAALTVDPTPQQTERLRLPPLSMYFPLCPERFADTEESRRCGDRHVASVDKGVQSSTCSESPSVSEIIEQPLTVSTSVSGLPDPAPKRLSTAVAKNRTYAGEIRQGGRCCCHCGESQSPNWYLMEQDRNRRLCNACGKYWKRTGAQRPAHLIQCSRETPRRRGRAPSSIVASRPLGNAGKRQRKIQAFPLVGSPLTPLSTDDAAASLLDSKSESMRKAARPLLPTFDAAAERVPFE